VEARGNGADCDEDGLGRSILGAQWEFVWAEGDQSVTEDSPIHQDARKTLENSTQSCIQKNALVLLIKECLKALKMIPPMRLVLLESKRYEMFAIMNSKSSDTLNLA
jgi:hypothetical protein